MAEKLDTYRAKRDWKRTSEPTGARGADAKRKPAAKGKRGGRRAKPARARFVVQEHHATRLHWDLRLEHDGVLASWAVPNGIPDDPATNRKAVRTEDHPLEYLDFHGDIPKGTYGAGKMTIWDRGTYECEKWRDDEVIATFSGERLTGRYALFRAGRDPKDWMIHRMDPPVDPAREPMPEHLVPMLAKAGTLPVRDAGWAYEVKWDGIRALVYSEPGRLRIESRNLRDLTDQYPEIKPLNRALSSHSAILDGEIVAFGDEGRPSFERLQQRMHLTSESVIRRRAREQPAAYLIFDLLYLDGHSLMSLPYRERRERLAELELKGAAWQVPDHQVGEGAQLLEATAHRGLEGLVAKRLDSVYEPGKRTNAWIKVKNSRRQELVIGGWLPGEGRRTNRIGALLVGHHDPDGAFRFAGRVGTGFTDKTLRDLARRLGPLVRHSSPFEQGPKPPRGAVYVEPELVADVEFTEWTREGVLRHPSYKGLREDKNPREVVREAPDSTGEEPAKRQRRAPAASPRRRGGAAKRGAKGPEALFDDVRKLPSGGYEVTVDGRVLKLSNYDKVLYPATGFTKGNLIEYYARIAPTVVPHLADRPLTLKRYPNGVDEQFFYEKQCPKHRPDWVQTAAVWSRHNKANIDFCLAQDRPTLVWAANLADIELHTSLSLAKEIERPTMLVFDLDPGPPADIVQCCEVGLILRGLFEGIGLQSFAKTSGSKGLQVYVPLNTDVTYERTKPFARAIAELMEAQLPKLVVSRMTKQLRRGKVLVDWSQNDEHKTTVNVYSVRARERPTVSTPVSWEEVEQAHRAGDGELLRFETDALLARVDDVGDLFAPVLSLVQELPAL